MKSSNGFNKKQKEEIREIVKSEIREALRKNEKPDVNVKNEVTAAIYSVLNEKNENMIKSLSEIEDKISQKETEKSLFAANMKGLLHVVCILAWTFLVLFVGVTVYLCFTDSVFSKNIFSVILLFILDISIAAILFIFHKSIKHMNKNDSYNALMFIIAVIAFIITILSTIK